MSSNKCRSKSATSCTSPRCPENKHHAAQRAAAPVSATDKLASIGFALSPETLAALQNKFNQNAKVEKSAEDKKAEAFYDDCVHSGQYVAEEYENLDIANHSDVGEEWVTLGDMADPAIARNNCYIASSEIVQNIDPAEFGAERLNVVSLTSKEANVTHGAVKATIDGKEMIFDFTARQFDPELPYPYVADHDTWQKTIEKGYGFGEMEVVNEDFNIEPVY
jgi:hypothetical protein